MASPQTVETGIDFSRVDPVRKHMLGLEVPGDDGCLYKYIRAGGAITANNFLIIDYAEGVNDFDQSSAAAQPVVGVAPVAIADNQFGWVKIKGVHVGANVATGVAAGDKLGTTSTAGRADKLDSSDPPTQGEGRAMLAAADGLGIEALTAESGNAATVILF